MVGALERSVAVNALVLTEPINSRAPTRKLSWVPHPRVPPGIGFAKSAN